MNNPTICKLLMSIPLWSYDNKPTTYQCIGVDKQGNLWYYKRQPYMIRDGENYVEKETVGDFRIVDLTCNDE